MPARFFALVAFLFAASPLWPQGFSPEEALKRIEVPSGFTAKLIAAEPLIRQPLSISFDERGRLWVLQYLQYPYPAGLKVVKRDEYLRTVWDKVPEPPPNGPKGVDRITILSDPDEKGQFTKARDFLSDLNLCSGFCLGNGGVYVLQAPYLLFYPDKNKNDKPDGPPEVLLKGFGMEDTHSLANNLQWGPDGWLYGAAGSTSTSKIINPSNPSAAPIEFQQGVWRFHPKDKIFELFAEGGGNIWGLDFDKYGECFAGTNYGGKAMMHVVQGAYYVKTFAKHGQLHNPFAYGYFDHVPYQNFQGGHVTNGGRIYQAERYPEEFRDTYMAGNLLSNVVNWHVLTPNGSTFKARHGGTFLKANDTWFRPVDCRQGPDGCLYVADWYDKRATHVDPIDNWDKTNGRIYKIDYPGKDPQPFDLSKLTSMELVELLRNPNKWFRIEAKRILAERGDKSVLPILKERALNDGDWKGLEALWAAYQLADVNDQKWVEQLLDSKDEHIRAWTIRLLSEPRSTAYNLAVKEKLDELYAKEKSPRVRVRMLQTTNGLRFDLGKMMQNDADADDPFLPLLYWWAFDYYTNQIADRSNGDLKVINDMKIWEKRVFVETVLPRLARKLLSKPDPEQEKLDRAAYLLKMAKSPAAIDATLSGFDLALTGGTVPKGNTVLLDAVKALPADKVKTRLRERLLVKLGDGSALVAIRQRVDDEHLSENDRLSDLKFLGDLSNDMLAGSSLLNAFHRGKTESYRLAALQGLQKQKAGSFAETLLKDYPASTGKIRSALQSYLLSREASALKLLAEVDSGKLKPAEISVDNLKNCGEFKNEKINGIIEKHWGKLAPQTMGEKLARIRSLSNGIKKTKGDPVHGKELFAKTCSACHQIFGEGGKVGPDLTSADRKNLDYMLTQIVDPSAIIRPEYISHTVKTTGGQVLSGLVKESSRERVVLLNVRDNQPIETSVARSDIEEIVPSAVSLMPEKLLDAFSDRDAADLMAYLQSDPPKK